MHGRLETFNERETCVAMLFGKIVQLVVLGNDLKPKLPGLNWQKENSTSMTLLIFGTRLLR